MTYRRRGPGTSGRAPAVFDERGLLKGKTRRLLTENQESVVRLAWAAGETLQRCAWLAGVSLAVIRPRLEDQLADLPRRGQGAGRKRREGARDPTTEEIWGRLTLEIQAGWTDEERESRWLGKPSE